MSVRTNLGFKSLAVGEDVEDGVWVWEQRQVVGEDTRRVTQ